MLLSDVVLSQNQYFSAFKQANRRDDDIAVANAAMKVEFKDDTNIVKNMALAFGGMAPITVMATNTTETLRGRFVFLYKC